ncbi:conserved hypothetical protein [Ricinus communis]|uniref:Uncharacterized protein n=1 Tax=Ricinus communis TaxID=3988 RepID=B9S3F6_RICCO|nr:conserved hypothetical protein [Ricinus communis]
MQSAPSGKDQKGLNKLKFSISISIIHPRQQHIMKAVMLVFNPREGAQLVEGFCGAQLSDHCCSC